MTIEVVIPSVAESINEVTLATWLVKDGDFVEMDQPICEVETDKASQELVAEKSGKIQLLISEGEDVAVGGLIAKIDTSLVGTNKETTKVSPIVQKEIAVSKVEPVLVEHQNFASGLQSPAAKKMVDTQNIDTNNIKGTGKNQRITKQDIIESISKGEISYKNSVNEYLSSSKSFSRDTDIKKMPRIRKVISERLVFAKNSTAMLTTFNEVNMQPIMDIRTKFKDKFKEKFGVNLGFMSFFTRACSLALLQYPEVNAYIDVEKGEIIYHDYVDISIAVSTPKGLVVPVIRNSESLTMDGIEKAVLELAKKGKDGTLTIEDMEGGTFTITNGGVFGSLMSTPIINPPQSAILGMHKIQDRPIVENGNIVIKPMMFLALSYDHRIIDGKESVGFLVMVKDLLENPEKLLLGSDPIETLLLI